MPMGFDRNNNESVDHFGSMDILTMLSFLVHNYRMSVYFYFLWISAMFYSFQSPWLSLFLNILSFLMAQTVKCLPTMRETQVWFLGREDPLEKEMATHSSTLAWKIPWMEEPGGLQSWGRKELDTTEQLHFLSFLVSFSVWSPSSFQKDN